MKDTREIAKDYTDWMVKTGGYAKDKTLRDEFAGLAMQAIRASDTEDMVSAKNLAVLAYQDADAMLKERNK
jgi:hypothetical protein